MENEVRERSKENAQRIVVYTFIKWYIYQEKNIFSPIMSKNLSAVPLVHCDNNCEIFTL
jgi:hypothetical protein